MNARRRCEGGTCPLVQSFYYHEKQTNETISILENAGFTKFIRFDLIGLRLRFRFGYRFRFLFRF